MVEKARLGESLVQTSPASYDLAKFAKPFAEADRLVQADILEIRMNQTRLKSEMIARRAELLAELFL
jgi:hypothetical protein